MARYVARRDLAAVPALPAARRPSVRRHRLPAGEALPPGVAPFRQDFGPRPRTAPAVVPAARPVPVHAPGVLWVLHSVARGMSRFHCAMSHAKASVRRAVRGEALDDRRAAPGRNLSSD